jgi:hypothetical protein
LAAHRRGWLERAVRLRAAARAAADAVGLPFAPLWWARHEREVESLQIELGPDRFRRCWVEGLAMSSHEGVAYALEDQPGPKTEPGRGST